MSPAQRATGSQRCRQDVRAGDAGPPHGSANLECDPDLAVDLRRGYAAITAGCHLNKRHWHTVTLDGSVPEDELLYQVDHSDELAVARLPRAERDKLNT
jgi:predicted DNA-binding protein (MmcQ/YjbR family)